MALKDNLSSKSNQSPSQEIWCNNSCGSFEFSTSDTFGQKSTDYRRFNRSKSLSNSQMNVQPSGEMRIIRERLLRTASHVEPSAIKNFSGSQKMLLFLLALVDFMSFCSMSIMAPFFPREASEKGLSDTVSGFIFSFYALVMFLTSPIFGKMLPKIGARFLFLSGMFTAGICNLFFGLLEYVENYTLFTTLCIVIRGFEALGASAFSTASYVFVVNGFPQNIGSVLGILETFVGLGMSTGPALGGLLYSLGGFPMPFFVLGAAMIVIIPINLIYLPIIDESSVTNKNTSMLSLLKVPAVLITGFVVVVVSSTWAFLDPTLEPHLRQFNLSPTKIGLIFLLFSGLYGLSSPGWGWLADKINNHWSMMVIGLLMCTLGLLLLGPCPLIPLSSSVWLTLVALSLLGISVALALLPTFPGILNNAINSGCGDSLGTYSIVGGIWSCMYALGEVIGPSLGGFLLQTYSFPIATTVMAGSTFSLAVITTIFFTIKSCYCPEIENASDSGISESWNSSSSVKSSSESSPLVSSGVDKNYKSFTQEDETQYYKNIRKEEIDDITEKNQVAHIKAMIGITGKGSCEI